MVVVVVDEANGVVVVVVDAADAVEETAGMGEEVSGFCDCGK